MPLAAALADGAHTFDVRAVDNAGNTGGSDQHAWDLDTVAPTVSVDSGPADDPTNSQNADFTFSASDAASGLSGTTCMLDTDSGASACDQAAGSSYTSVAEGSRTFTVTATDDAGNSAFEDSKPAEGGWTKTACETAGGTFKAGLQRSEIECTCSIRS